MSMQSQIDGYIGEVGRSPKDHDALTFWSKRQDTYNLLAPLAQDIVTAPASQAYVERIFQYVAGLRQEGVTD